MNKMSLAQHPFLLGFEELERFLERMSKSGNDGYPPFNIEQTGKNAYRITLAVAGFSEDDLEIVVEDNQLIVRGRKKPEDEEGRIFLHRGIASRQFERRFAIADGVEVRGATLENGLLHIDLEKEEPEPVVRKVEIRKS